MTIDELRELVDDWRTTAQECRYEPTGGAETYDLCADELEAVLDR